MSYTRGQETFWNRLTITFQNLYRLFIFTLILTTATTGFLFYFFTPKTLWINSIKGFYWILAKIKAEGLIVGISKIHALINYEIEIFTFHLNNLLKAVILSSLLSITFFIFCLYIFSKRGKKISSDIHLSGAKLITTREFNKEAKELIKRQIKEITRDTKQRSSKKTFPPFCCTADNLKIPYQFLSNHMSAIGATGTGKTTVIKHRIDHAKSIGAKGIVLDINGEIYSQVGDNDDVILSLFDKRSAFWDYGFERSNLISIRPIQIAEYLIPSANYGEPIWWKGPRIILEDLLTQCGSTSELWKLIQNPSEDLIKYLVSGLAKKTAGKPDSKTAFSMVISTILDCRYFGFLNHWPIKSGKKNPFSILNWTQNDDKRWVYIVADEKDITVMQPIIRLWFNIAIHGILTRSPFNNLPPICVIIDEMRSVGKLDLLPSAINRMRKYGGQGLFGYQSDFQLQHLYGTHDASAINSGIGTKFVFNITNEKEAEDVAQSFGNQEVKRKSFSMTYSASSYGDRETLGEQIITKPVVTATDISKLPNGHCYIKCRAIDPVKTRILYKNWKQKQALHTEFHSYPEIDMTVNLSEKMPEKTNIQLENKEFTSSLYWLGNFEESEKQDA